MTPVRNINNKYPDQACQYQPTKKPSQDESNSNSKKTAKAKHSPLQKGFIRIKSSDKSSAQISSFGNVEIMVTPETTAAELKAQLFQLGAQSITEKELEKIAAQNGNEKFDNHELENLDGYLEESLRGDKEVLLAAVKQMWCALEYAHKSLRIDRDFMLRLVKENGLALQYAHESLKKDREVVMAAVKQTESALDYAHASLQKDRDFILRVVKKNGLALIYAHESLKKDIEVVLAAVKQNGNALQHAHESLKKNREVVLVAVKEDGKALQYAHASLKKDKEVVLAAVKQNGHAFKHAHASLKKNREVVLAAVEQNWRVLKYYVEDKSMNKDREIVLAAINQDHNALGWTDELLKNDVSFLETAFNKNINIFHSVPGKFRTKFYEKREKIAKSLKAFNIDTPGRFRSIDMVQEILHNRKNLAEVDPRPLAIIIYPKNDRAGAFSAKNQIKELIKNGYRVVYFEAKSEGEVYDSLEDATIVKKADLLILGGHGIRTHLALGTDDPAKSKILDEKHSVDLSDEQEMKTLSTCLAENSVIILESCSTGEGKENADNVANLVKRVFPQAKVFAPIKPAHTRNYIYDKQGQVIAVNFSIGEKLTYSIE